MADAGAGSRRPEQGRQLAVALVQLRSDSDPAINLDAVERFTRQAADAGAQLVVFPEATMGCFGSDLAAIAEPVSGPFANGARRVAASCGVTVVVGMFEPADANRVFNTLLLTDGRGVEATYRKIHLYDAFGVRESDTVAPGSELVTAEVAGVRVGLATCYDVRFAEQFLALGRAGAEVICLPASWGDGLRKVEQWQALTVARAIDAQAWLLACDQASVDTGGKAPLGVGHSRVVGPLGEVVASLADADGLLCAALDLDAVGQAREAVPALFDRR